ncbi:type II toxin-antitoxin system HicA family toxin, partial [uncultured Selenomonas sp.]
MTPKEAENLIMRDGWRLENIQGSHHQYTHPCKPGKVTIP